MTKILLVAALIAIVWYLWRAPSVRASRAAPKAPRGPVQGPQDMVSCPVCSVHLPRSEALPGPDGQLYCCQEHRLLAGK
jgi:uncharacterized protein